jgi:iron complex outermembrane receptor protein
MIPSSHAADDADDATEKVSKNVFEDVIVVTGEREPVFTNSQFMEAVSIPVVDAAALVGKLPGAALINNGGLSGQVAYRGVFGTRIGTTLNGQRFASGGPNMMDPPLHYAPPPLIEKIEVSRGAPGLEYGPALMGGINAVLKQVQFQQTSAVESHYDLSAGARSNGNSHSVGGVIGAANDRYRMHVLFSDEQGQDQDFPGGTIAGTSHDRSVYGLAGGMRNNDSELDFEYRRQTTGPTGNPPFGMDIEYVDSDFASLGWSSKFNDIGITAHVGYADIEHGMNNYSLRPPPTIPAGDRRTLTAATTWDSNIKIDTLTALGPLSVGVDTERTNHSATITNPNNPDFFLESLPDILTKRTGAYLQLMPSVADWQLQLGVRLDRHDAQAGIAATGPAVPNMPAMLAHEFNATDRQWQATTADALVRAWRVQGDATWRISLSRRNRAPGYVERFAWLPTTASAGLADGNTYVGNQGLTYETATTLDTGVDFHRGGGYIRPTLFLSSIDDYIQGTPFDATPGVIDSAVERVSRMNGDPTPLQTNNVTARLYGLDVDFGYQLNRSLALRGDVTLTRGTRRDIDDNLYRITPPRLMLAIDYQHNDWEFSLNGTFQGHQRRVSETNSEMTTSGYSVFNVSANWQPTAGLTIGMGIENLFDRQYREHLSGYNRNSASDVGMGERLPGIGRNVFLTAQMRR